MKDLERIEKSLNDFAQKRRFYLDIDAQKQYVKEPWRLHVYGLNRLSFILDVLIYTTNSLVSLKNLCKLLSDYLNDEEAEKLYQKIKNALIIKRQIMEYLGLKDLQLFIESQISESFVIPTKLIETPKINVSDFLSAVEVVAKLKTLSDTLNKILDEGVDYVRKARDEGKIYQLIKAMSARYSNSGTPNETEQNTSN